MSNHGFYRDDGILTADGIPLDGIATGFGTPLYVYSAEAIEAAYARLADSLIGGHANRRLHYAVKANSNLAVLRLIARLGAGADIVSGGELQRALAAGFDPAHIIFSGVGKTDSEITTALEKNIGQINAESGEEVARVLALARAAKLRTATRLALRMNPDIGAGAHAKIATGGAETKFGIPADDIPALARDIAAQDAIAFGGLAVHIGSQITDPAPFAAAWTRLREMADALRGAGIDSPVLDCGGGIGIDYGGVGDGRALEDIGEAANAVFANTDYALGFEPGRALVAAAGVLLVRVLGRKTSGGKNFIITDGAMNDLLRPALYDAPHRVLPVESRGAGNASGSGAKRITADIVGPVCETGDFLARDITIAGPEPGDMLAVMDTGAYGAVMRSNYNSRPLAAEVMVLDGVAHPVSVPQSIDDLLARDIIPDELE